MAMLIELDDDAFGDAQIRSKLMLVESLETMHLKQFPKINLYAGWYGMVAFLMLSRDYVVPGRIRSYDIDPKATAVANRLNRRWIISQSIFQAYTYDINRLRPVPDEVDVVVNTATEHMSSNEWFTSILPGTIVALQGTDMVHPDETVPNPIYSLEEMARKYPLEDETYSLIDFQYPTGDFTRYQVIGRKF